MSDVLASPIQFIKGVGPVLAKKLSKKGIATIEDALYFIPRDYEDRRVVTPMAQLRPGTGAVICGKVVSAHTEGAGRRKRFAAVLSDGSGEVMLTWFHAFPGLQAEFAPGKQFLVYGEVRFFGSRVQITHPDYEPIPVEGGPLPRTLHFGRVVPIYSETEGLNQKTLRRLMGEALKQSLPHLDETIPQEILDRLKLPALRLSFSSLHFPANMPLQGLHLQRIVFEEFFVLQLGLQLKKQKHQRQKAPKFGQGTETLAQFASLLPFTMTDDQKNSLAQIAKDFEKGVAMCRLVQGDVGAGKTVVALGAALIAAKNGYQTAMMAPTEILAQQHFKTAEALLKPLGIPVHLLTHAGEGKKLAIAAVKEKTPQVVIGTHALFQSGVEFGKLGFVVVDEQHRFGVEQRAELLRKVGGGAAAHLLMMTATPIPRTLALTLYGDLDFSVIRQKPVGRKPIKTSIVRETERPKLYQRMREVVKRGEQVYVIYPLVEASEKLDLKSATEMHARLAKEIFPDLRVALVHGRMKSDEKDQVIQDFKNKKYDILISTTVIEVGIDVPNASLMVIEHPERLGLSQLHQLRGRVGRGSQQSECLLVADKFVTERIRIMTRTDDGFEIAEEDLRIRGPGEFLGTRQSGLPGFRVGNVLRDAEWLQRAKEEAERVIAEDPDFKLPKYARLRQMVESRWKEKIEFLRGG